LLVDLAAVFDRLDGYENARLSKGGSGFVEFTGIDTAQRALEAKQGCRVHDRTIAIEYAKSAKRPRQQLEPEPREPVMPHKEPLQATPITLEVSGVPGDASLREVSHLFRSFPGFIALRAAGSLFCAEFRTRPQSEVIVPVLTARTAAARDAPDSNSARLFCPGVHRRPGQLPLRSARCVEPTAAPSLARALGSRARAPSGHCVLLPFVECAVSVPAATT
jgi:hypothetical protein